MYSNKKLVNLNSFTNDILAVIVVYNQCINESSSYLSLRSGLETLGVTNFQLLIYDNSPTEQEIRHLDFTTFSIKYFWDSSNAGISKAYNYAARLGQQLNKEYLLLLDQDTILNQQLFLAYFNAVINNSNISLFAPILKLTTGQQLSPCRFFMHRGFSVELSTGIHSFSKFTPVNSGILVSIKKFIEAGGYNEKVRLDLSDFQFIERFRKYNQYFYLVDAICIQNFSNINDNCFQLLTRFSFYCEGAKNSNKDNWLDNIIYFFLVFLRCLSLVKRTKKLAFFKTFYNKYILG